MKKPILKKRKKPGKDSPVTPETELIYVGKSIFSITDDYTGEDGERLSIPNYRVDRVHRGGFVHLGFTETLSGAKSLILDQLTVKRVSRLTASQALILIAKGGSK